MPARHAAQQGTPLERSSASRFAVLAFAQGQVAQLLDRSLLEWSTLGLRASKGRCPAARKVSRPCALRMAISARLRSVGLIHDFAGSLPLPSRQPTSVPDLRWVHRLWLCSGGLARLRARLPCPHSLCMARPHQHASHACLCRLAPVSTQAPSSCVAAACGRTCWTVSTWCMVAWLHVG